MEFDEVLGSHIYWVFPVFVLTWILILAQPLSASKVNALSFLNLCLIIWVGVVVHLHHTDDGIDVESLDDIPEGDFNKFCSVQCVADSVSAFGGVIAYNLNDSVAFAINETVVNELSRSQAQMVVNTAQQNETFQLNHLNRNVFQFVENVNIVQSIFDALLANETFQLDHLNKNVFQFVDNVNEVEAIFHALLGNETFREVQIDSKVAALFQNTSDVGLTYDGHHLRIFIDVKNQVSALFQNTSDVGFTYDGVHMRVFIDVKNQVASMMLNTSDVGIAYDGTHLRFSFDATNQIINLIQNTTVIQAAFDGTHLRFYTNLTTDNIATGSKKFFSNELARAAITNTSGITYDSVTGEIGMVYAMDQDVQTTDDVQFDSIGLAIAPEAGWPLTIADASQHIQLLTTGTGNILDIGMNASGTVYFDSNVEGDFVFTHIRHNTLTVQANEGESEHRAIIRAEGIGTNGRALIESSGSHHFSTGTFAGDYGVAFRMTGNNQAADPTTIQWTFFSASNILSLETLNNGSGTTLYQIANWDTQNKRLGIGRIAATYSLEVEGNAGKTDGGDTWVVISDNRTKTDIEVLNTTFALEKLRELNPVTYRYNDDFLFDHPQTANITRYGWLASDWETTLPTSVIYTDIDLYGEEPGTGVKRTSPIATNLLNIDTSNVVPLLSAAAKEQDSKVLILEAQVAVLETTIAALEVRLAAAETAITGLGGIL